MPRYANSDLGEFRDTLFSFNAKKPSAAALTFGTIFHALTLECLTPANVAPAVAKQLGAMRESILQNRFARQVLLKAEVEQVNTWVDRLTGLPCKSQLDIWAGEDELIVDLKTTSAKTYGDFLECIDNYNYDRQAAFYLDGKPEAKRFVILGVQKQAPFKVFYFEATACRECIEGGRKKYQALLRHIERVQFIPSSWGQPSTATIVGISDGSRLNQLIAA